MKAAEDEPKVLRKEIEGEGEGEQPAEGKEWKRRQIKVVDSQFRTQYKITELVESQPESNTELQKSASKKIKKEKPKLFQSPSKFFGHSESKIEEGAVKLKIQEILDETKRAQAESRVKETIKVLRKVNSFRRWQAKEIKQLKIKGFERVRSLRKQAVGPETGPLAEETGSVLPRIESVQRVEVPVSGEEKLSSALKGINREMIQTLEEMRMKNLNPEQVSSK